MPATYARARLIGTLVQPHQPWDEVGVTRLRGLVLADPPMTDKRIAAELGRTVTQIRWKMQDLGLIGVRDLSKLAKVTASEGVRSRSVTTPSARSKPSEAAPRMLPADPFVSGCASLHVHLGMSAPLASLQVTAPQEVDLQAALVQALKSLEQDMTIRLKNSVSASEIGMIQAARAAIAEKARIDQRLIVRVKRSMEAAVRSAAEAQAAIERFIAERGVTRNETGSIQLVVSRLQARVTSSCAMTTAGPSTSVIASTAKPVSSLLRRPAASS